MRDDIQCFSEKHFVEFRRPVLNAKIFKILPHEWMDTDVSIWMDGNHFPLKSVEETASLLGDAHIALWKHPIRNTVAEERLAIRHYYPDMTLYVENYWRYLQKIGYKDDKGLAWCGVIIRRHCKETTDFCNFWWSQITRWCSRDQMSFPFTMANHPEVKVKFITEDKDEYFKRIEHIK